MASSSPDRYGVVGVVVQDSQWLVIRRSELVRAPGRFCFPGGGIEAGETEAEALVREFQEELGVEVKPVTMLWKSRTSWNVHLAWWHAELLDDAAAIVPNPAEVSETRWLAPHDIALLPGLLSSNHDFLAAWSKQTFHLPGVYATPLDQRRGIEGNVGAGGGPTGERGEAGGSNGVGDGAADGGGPPG